MRSYLKILDNIIHYGKDKNPTRSIGNVGQVDGSVKTIGMANVNWEHDFREGFPLLTTKKMAFKTMCIELEGFIKGITDKSWYQERGCRIWNEWANPQKVQDEIDYLNEAGGDISWAKNEIQKQQNDLGPLYGYQWRNFNKTYKTQDEDDGDYNNYTDQLKYIVDTLKNNPYDRRMVCSAWNPNQFEHMALVPCHVLWNVTVYGQYLYLSWHQRSCDATLGIPFNIASYSLLTLLLCKESGFLPGTIAARFMDCHIYENQKEAVKTQLSRKPFQLPKIKIPDTLKSGKPFSIFDWTHEDVQLINYEYHPSIKCEVVV